MPTVSLADMAQLLIRVKFWYLKGKRADEDKLYYKFFWSEAFGSWIDDEKKRGEPYSSSSGHVLVILVEQADAGVFYII